MQKLNRYRHTVRKLLGRCYRWVRRLPTQTYLNLTMPWRLLQVYQAMRSIQRNAHRIGTRPRRPGEPIGMMVVSELPRDPRVERAAKALAQNGYPIHLICPKWVSPDMPPLPPNWGEGITTQLLPRSLACYNFPYLFNRSMYRAAVASGAWAYHCHDLSTCLIGLAAAARTGAHVVCDFHEWYSENVSWVGWRQQYRPHPWFLRALFRRAERLCLRHASRVITVCDSLAAQIRDAFQEGRDLGVVRNIPPLLQGQRGAGAGQDLRQLIGVPKEMFLLLYQGGVGPARCLEPIIEAVAGLPEVALVIRGPNIQWYEADYQRLFQLHGGGRRLFCLGPVPSNRVVAEASSADAGIWALKDLCVNFRCALPNKIFEYLAAGIPVLAANLPEARRLVEGHSVGLCFDPESPRSIAAAVHRMAQDKALRARCRQNIPAALEAQRADVEWLKLVRLYQALAPGERQAAA